MSSSVQEVEAVFAVASVEDLERVPGLLREEAVFLSRPTLRRVEDFYVDTSDRRLMRAGVACRLRRTGRTMEVTLKALNPIRKGLATRTEWTERVRGIALRFPLAFPDSQVAERVRPLLGRRRLHLLFRVEQIRRIWRVRTVEGDEWLASADRVRWVAAGGRSCAGLRFEVERITGSQKRFGKFARIFRSQDGFSPSERSKFEGGLALLGEKVPQFAEKRAWRIQERDTYGRAAQRVMGRLMALLLWHTPAAQLGLDPERLHALRVSVRRLRSALGWWQEALPEALVLDLKADLQWIGHVTGHARDWDVLLGSWSDLKERGERERGWEKLEKIVRERGERARREACLALFSRRFQFFLKRVKCWEAKGCWPVADGSAADRPVGQEAFHRLKEQFRKVFRCAKRLSRDSPPDRYHRVRIALKRLRYGLEFFEPLLDKSFRDLRKDLARFQDLLGEHQDAVTAVGRMRDMGPAAEASIRFWKRRAARARRRFRKEWAKWTVPKRVLRMVRL